VLRDGRALRLVLDRDRLRPGAFWFDHRRDRIVVADDPHGAIETSAPGWRIVDNIVQVNHGAGITTGGHVEVRGNDGPGLWTDIDAQDTTYVGNVVRNNTHVGIFHEISAAATIRDNVVTGNGHGFDAWLWGAGILIGGSHDVEVAGDRLGQNAAGIALIQQDRRRSDVDGTPRTLHDLSIHDNEVTMSRGPSGGVTDNGYDAMFSDPSITWTGNTWHGSGGRPFWWSDEELTLAQWRDLGHDQAH
jgi:parallel beta-helix repeat protein